VLKGYQQLLVEKRRGRGMYVADGAKRALMKGERQKFLEDEWPRIYATIQRLGFDAAELLAVTPSAGYESRPVVPGPSAGIAPANDDVGAADLGDLDDLDDKN
jgi:hypothetical protein